MNVSRASNTQKVDNLIFSMGKKGNIIATIYYEFLTHKIKIAEFITRQFARDMFIYSLLN